MRHHEIGSANEVELKIPDTEYLVHVRGNPAQEALLIESMLKEGKNQTEIGNALSLSQPQISKRLALLNLSTYLFEKLREGKLRPSAGYLLSKLPEAKQRKYEKVDRITIKGLEQDRRELLISKDLETLLLAKGPDPAPRVHKCKRCGAEVPCE